MKKYISITFLICALGLVYSCSKKWDLIDPAAKTDGLAFIKFVDASPNFRTVFKGADSFNVFVNGLKLNGAFLTYASVFPTATNLYAGLPAGIQSIRIATNGKNTPDSITLATITKTMVAGSYYSLFLTDSGLSTIEGKQMWLKDNFALTDTSHFTIRFVDAVLDDAGPVDVYSVNNGANIFTNISPGTATPFISLPYNIVADSLKIRSAGTQTPIATVISGYTRSRAYTVLYRGSLIGTGTKARVATAFAND